MPKEETHLRDIRRLRMEKRTKRFSTQPATIYWQILGSGTYGGPTSLYLHTDHRRYLFNCGEGTQRMTSQLSLSKALAQLEHVFITSKTWKHLGGLPGLCLSVRGAGAPDITIHGPKGCMELYEATKGFLTLFEFDVEAHTVEDGDFEDGGVKVEQIVLTRNGGLKCPPLEENWREDDQGKWDGFYDSDVQAYICHFSPRPGKLDIDKCIQLGIKPGPMLGLLKAGKDVTLDNGTVVRSSDVVGESSPSSAFLILDIPDMEYCHNLEDNLKLRNIDRLDTVFHFSPSDVFLSPKYKAYCNSLGVNVKHILLNESCRGLGMTDVTSYTHKLKNIRSDLFTSLIGADDCCSISDLETRLEHDRAELGENVVRAVTGLRVNVRPHPEAENRINLSEVVIYDQENSVKEFLEGEKIEESHKFEYKEAIQEALKHAKEFIKESSSSPVYPKVTFLGTGSSMPSKYRNVSSILIETSPDSYMMLDCGEGTVSQMVRSFGSEKTKNILQNLKCVYISHMHADHHLGLISIIQMREKILAESQNEKEKLKDLLHSFFETKDNKLYIISTDKIVPFLTYYHKKFESLLTQCHFVKCERLILYNEMDLNTYEENSTKKIQTLFPDELSKMLNHIGLSEFYTSRAIHCPNAFCVSFRLTDGYKISYSGDTRPCEKFRDISTWGGSPDLLIHEATMEHFMMYDAIIKKHTTFTEAIKEGELMNAKFTMLTHFSQRYAKMPFLEEIEGHDNVGIAFDNMTVDRNSMTTIRSLYPALKRWLSDYVEELLERAEQYKMNHGVDMETDIETPYLRKTQLAEKLKKRHEDKHQWFLNVKKRKLLEKQEKESKSTDEKTEKL